MIIGSILELNNLNAISRAEKRGIYKRCLLKDKQSCDIILWSH
jgi:hypothetical protein